jgi:hypothetical protein
VIAIDGKPAQMADLSAARERLRNLPAGTVVRFDILRGKDRSTVQVRLRNLVPPQGGANYSPAADFSVRFRSNSRILT